MKTYLNLLSNFFKVFCSYLLFSCSNKQIYERVKLPENGNYILVSGKTEPDNYYNTFETYMLNPDNKKLSILEVKDAENEFNSKSENIFYREFIYSKDSKKYLLLPEDKQKEFQKYLITYPLPKVNTSKDKFIYPTNQGFGIYSMQGKLLQKFDIIFNSIGWVDDSVFYLERREKNANNSIYSLNLETGKKKLIYKPEFFIDKFQISPDKSKLATIEYNSVWNPIEYSVKILHLATNKIIAKQVMPNYTKDIEWSSNGSLAILYKMKEEEGLFPPFSIYLISSTESFDLLNLPVYEQPGFIFSGKGYAGVTDFSWSPDGKEIVYISSEPGNCNRDEGGNSHCALDLFKVNINTKKIEKLTDIKNKSLQSIDWIGIQK